MEFEKSITFIIHEFRWQHIVIHSYTIYTHDGCRKYRVLHREVFRWKIAKSVNLSLVNYEYKPQINAEYSPSK